MGFIKKYGVVAAGTAMIAVMFCCSPLSVFADGSSEEAGKVTVKEAEDKAAKDKAEEKAKKESEEKAKKESEEKARKESEEKAKKESEEKAKKESQKESEGKETKAASETESESETKESKTETKAETETETKAETETETKAETETETKAETETSETEPARKKKAVSPKKKSSAKEKSKKKKSSEKNKKKVTSPGKKGKKLTFSHSRHAGVAPWKGHRVDLPDLAIKQQLRFRTIKNVKYKAAADKVNVYEKMRESSKQVGYVNGGGRVAVISEEGGWDYIECGQLRGFVKKSELSSDSELTDIRKEIISDAVSGVSDKSRVSQITSDENAKFLKPEVLTVDVGDNGAFTYRKTTAIQTVIKKKYAVVDTAAAIAGDKKEAGSSSEEGISVKDKESVNIKEEKSSSSRTVGTIKNGGLLYVIADEKQPWVYVESGDVRGFIQKGYLAAGKDVDAKVKKKGEDSFAQAKEKLDPDKNEAFYYSLLTTVDKTAEDELRETIIKAASKCVGNPYVWGGTSLTSGADCSGFVQTIYGKYGISLPRVADDQSEVGKKITIDSAEAGDLLFFADSSGYVYHVAICDGNGGSIEARNERYGIVKMNSRPGASWATDVVSGLFDK